MRTRFGERVNLVLAFDEQDRHAVHFDFFRLVRFQLLRGDRSLEFFGLVLIRRGSVIDADLLAEHKMTAEVRGGEGGDVAEHRHRHSALP